MNAKTQTHFSYDDVMAVLVGTDIHVLRQSLSSFALFEGNNILGRYCCLDGCCDRGVRPNTIKVVEQAKAAGGLRVIIRTPYQCGGHYPDIAGLPVSDVSNNLGPLLDGYEIIRG